MMNKVSDFSKIHTIISELVLNDDMFNVMDFCSLKSDNFKIECCKTDSIDHKYFFRIISNYHNDNCLKIYFDSSKDCKAFLYDIRYFIKNAASHAMHTIVTDTGYSIRQYFAEEDNKLLVWEISDNGDLIDETIKCYFNTKELYDKLNEELFSYGSYNILNGLSGLEYGPYYNRSIGFKYPENVQRAINKLSDDSVTESSEEINQQKEKAEPINDIHGNSILDNTNKE